MTKQYKLKIDVTITDSVIAEKGAVVAHSIYTDERLAAANAAKGLIPVLIDEGLCLWTGEKVTLETRTHWLTSDKVTEVENNVR